ncbi:MAG: tryptophan-rich sensory protein [Bacteroidales bacterium]|nr:tryptophan-rich sensory protein [Bacteroidales bacterium]
MKYINLLFFALMVVMNYLANALPLNGKTTGELSGMFPNLFVPAGITFSIWGVIYLLLLVFCILQFLPSGQQAVTHIGWLFALTCVLNGLWIVFWHYGKVSLSVMVMLGLLVSLVWLNTQLKETGPVIIKAAFGIYLGWICIATIANVTALLVHVNWGGWGISAEVWTIVLIATGMVITTLVMLRLNNPWAGLAVIWAFAGIIIKRQGDYRSIVIAAALAAVVVMLVMVLVFLRKSGAPA